MSFLQSNGIWREEGQAIAETNQTIEERMRAYPDPELETKRLEIFQKMIEGTQALLGKQLDKQGSLEGQTQTKLEMGQVPSD